jgi:hypothetical protein
MSTPALALRDGRFVRVLTVAAASFRAQWFYFVPAALYLAGNWILLSRLPSYGTAPVVDVLVALLSFTVPVGLIAMLVLRLIQYAAIEKPASPARRLMAELRDLVLRPARVINALPVFAAMIFFNKAMVELKPAIPALSPFAWDEAFMEVDRALHFGLDPWVLLQPFLGFDIVTFLVNMAYNFWFVALFGTWFWFGFQKEASELRTRFFLAYMLAWWLGGGILAVVFSSAGPVYYGAIGLSPDPFAPLMAYLHDVDSRIPIWCLKTQALLWDGYTGKAAALGISAFPSMHNASAALFALATWRASRAAGIAFAVYAAVILVGSVHLGWHYAVDGYAGIGLGLLAWWGAAPLARWIHGCSSMRRLNDGLRAL